MKKFMPFIVILILVSLISYVVFNQIKNAKTSSEHFDEPSNAGILNEKLHPLSIESLRKGSYLGSDLVTEQTLEPGSNYQRYIVSYKSDGLKIYALLTVPNGTPPPGGFPVIIFNHGFIPPAEYRTTERYIAYTDAFSRNGYILLRSDYRGHGSSEGVAAGGYGSNDYTIDILNAVASIKKYPNVNVNKIGMWGHSMGGFVTLRNMVVNKDVKVSVIWAGVIASYPDLFSKWRRTIATPTPNPANPLRSWRLTLVEEYGTPEENPTFWNSISANSYLKDISGPIQLHHGTADTSVPLEFSEIFEKQMKDAGKTVELYTYPGDDHNIAANFNIAMQRSVEFFDTYLKN